jgi:ribose/xylose/arabinose/galactoside ABC-type transport system permease subunit
MNLSPQFRSEIEKLIAFRKVKRNVSIFGMMAAAVSFVYFAGGRPDLSAAIIAGLLGMGVGFAAMLVSLPIFSAFEGLPAFWFLAPSKK